MKFYIYFVNLFFENNFILPIINLKIAKIVNDNICEFSEKRKKERK